MTAYSQLELKSVDPWFIVSSSPEEARIIRATREINDSKSDWVIDKINKEVICYLQANPDKMIKDITIACYGLAFKPNIDDLRESPALAITKRLAEQNFNILAIESNIASLPLELPSNITLSDLQLSASADIHLLLVDHEEFKNLDSGKYNSMVDTKGIWS